MPNKKFILRLFFSLLPAFIFPADIFHFDVSVFSGVRSGSITKSIYLENTDTKVSRLDWEEKPVFLAGLKTDFTIWKFESDFRFSFGFPLSCGSMYDSDWNLDGIKKTYTISECNILQNFDASINLSFHTPEFSAFRIDPSIEIQYLFKNFKAHDGYGWYGGQEHAKIPRGYDVAWDDPLARKAKKIRDIDYYRHTVLTFFGVKGTFFASQKLTFQAEFFISPFSYNYSLDTHYRSEENTHYLDIQTGSFAKYKINLKSQYKLNRYFAVFTDVSILSGKEEYGDLYSDVYSDNLTKFSSQPTGSSMHSVEFNAGIKFAVK